MFILLRRHLMIVPGKHAVKVDTVVPNQGDNPSYSFLQPPLRCAPY